MGKISDFHITFSAVLLAGGESRRMGQDKAEIILRGAPLWQRQIDLLRSLGPEKIFISGRTRPSWLPQDTELLLDDPPSRGPLSGVTKALEQMRTSHLIALAVDMPFMTGGQMRSHCRLAIEGCGLLPVIGERAEPLAAIYPREAAGDFSTASAGKDFSLQRLCRRLVLTRKLSVFEVPAEDTELYRSVNEPADLEPSPEFGA